MPVATMVDVDERWAACVKGLGLNPSDAEKGEVLGNMVREATAPGRAALAAWNSPETESLGRQLLVQLDFAALMATAHANPHPDPANRSWLLTQMVEAELHLRGQIAAKLRLALQDKSELDESPPAFEAERPPPRRRVCDEAYLLLRRLFHPEEDQVGARVEADGFLAMPFDLRDQAIHGALECGRWNLSPFTLY